jgi:hypothetical protein
MSETASGDMIELRVDNVAQLFHTLDPFPFRERDLDEEAEEFIVGWAREPAADRVITIVVHLPEAEAQTKVARELKEAFQGYFSHHADAIQREINELFLVGRRSLGIGASILAACLLLAHLAGGYLIESPFRRLVEEISHSGLGSELAAAGNIPVRLAVAGTAARSVSPACRGQC